MLNHTQGGFTMASADLTRINTNIQAMNALNALNKVNSRMAMHQLRLATGKRINSAADDAAGFTIASKLKVKSAGLGTALDNIGSAKNLMTVAEGHLTNIQDILTKMKSKAQQAANGTLGTDERNAIMAELEEFNNQIDAEVEQAQWAGTDLLNGTAISFQIGTGAATADALSFDVVANSTAAGFTSADLNVTASTASDSLSNAAVLGTANIAAAGGDLATSTAYSQLDGLSSGNYTVQVTTSTTAGTGTTTTVQIRLFDSQGNAVTIDSDGDGAGGTNATSTTLSISGVGAAAPAEIDLGVGLSVTLGAITTAADGSAVYQVTYNNANKVSSQADAQSYMSQIDTAVNYVSEGLSYIGSTINRLTFQEESISVAKANTDSAHSRIVDADMAWEQLEATKMQILQQTATAMLSQANMAPQSVLALFGK
jgi:flagellin